MAQAAGLGGPRTEDLWPIWPSRVRREPLWFGAQRVSLGTPRGGFVPDNERWAHDEPVPEFEIDAQPVQWSQYVEFVDDGGYDEPRWWGQAGWAWLERQQRRAPPLCWSRRARAVLAQRAGQLQRVASAQAVAHVSWHEADAWCRWASRRLPTEPEWEIAATTGVSRGFVWGDVHEWMAGRATRWSDEPPSPAPAWAGDCERRGVAFAARDARRLGDDRAAPEAPRGAHLLRPRARRRVRRLSQLRALSRWAISAGLRLGVLRLGTWCAERSDGALCPAR